MKYPITQVLELLYNKVLMIREKFSNALYLLKKHINIDIIHNKSLFLKFTSFL